MYRYYGLRKHTKHWRNQRKADLIEMAESSLASTKETLGDWHDFHEWFVAQGSQVKSKANKASFEILCRKVDDAVARVQDVVDDYADDETVLETIVDSVVGAAMVLGLEPHDTWEGADDGAVWFVNPDTGFRHYFLLGEHHDGWKFEIMSRPIPTQAVERGDDRWKQLPALNLSGQVLVWSNPAIHHPARWLDAYHGVYNGLGIVERDVPDSVDAALDKLRHIRRVQA